MPDNVTQSDARPGLGGSPPRPPGDYDKANRKNLIAAKSLTSPPMRLVA